MYNLCLPLIPVHISYLSLTKGFVLYLLNKIENKLCGKWVEILLQKSFLKFYKGRSYFTDTNWPKTAPKTTHGYLSTYVHVLPSTFIFLSLKGHVSLVSVCKNYYHHIYMHSHITMDHRHHIAHTLKLHIYLRLWKVVIGRHDEVGIIVFLVAG